MNWVKMYDTSYQVSDYGEIRNKNKKVLSKELTDSGYYRVCISEKGVKTHIYNHAAVIDHFVEKPKSNIKLFRDHKDDNKLNNHFSNLQWLTNSDNIKKSSKSRDRLPDDIIILIKSLINDGLSYRQILMIVRSRGYDVHNYTITRIKQGTSYKNVV